MTNAVDKKKSVDKEKSLQTNSSKNIDSEVKRIIRRLNKLLKIPSVISHEQVLMDYLEKQLNIIKTHRIERTKHLLVAKPKQVAGKKNQSIVSIHIDRQGFITYKKNILEYAAFSMQKKYLQPITTEEHVFKKVASRHIGESVIAFEETSGKLLEEQKIIGSEYNFKNKTVLFKLENESKQKKGTPWFLKPKLNKVNDYLAGQIDNAISVAVIIELIKNGFKGTIIFTTEEEIGNSWKHLHNFLKEENIFTKNLIVLDTTPYKYIYSIDKGVVVLRNKDESGIFNKNLTKKIIHICEENEIPYELKDEQIKQFNKKLRQKGLPAKKYGRTELGRIVEHTKGKINGTTVQIPSVNYHTNHELTSQKALKNFYFLLKKLLL